MKIITHIFLLSTIVLSTASADNKQQVNMELLFVSGKEAVNILSAEDDFISRLSNFDRSARMKTNRRVGKEEFLTFLSKNILAWNESEKNKIRKVFNEIVPHVHSSGMSIPKVNVILTSGKEEGNAVYTRKNAIILQRDKLSDIIELKRLFAHELFHIYTRNNSKIKDKLYNAIGFYKVEEIDFPSNLADRKITNPDAPKNDYVININHNGRSLWVMPILFSRTDTYLPDLGGEFFDYLQLGFLSIGKNKSLVQYKPNKPIILHISQIRGFFEKIGGNTDYIIHPEEILADNFALLILGNQNVRTPEILEKLRNILLSS